MKRGLRHIAAVIAVGIVAALAPLSARAEHCNNIFLYTGQGLLLYPSALTCPEEDPNADVILPGGTLWRVRWNTADAPEAGVLAPDGSCSGACLSFQGKNYALKLALNSGGYWTTGTGTDLQMQPGDTVGDKQAVISICYKGTTDCQTRTFRTVDSM